MCFFSVSSVCHCLSFFFASCYSFVLQLPLVPFTAFLTSFLCWFRLAASVSGLSYHFFLFLLRIQLYTHVTLLSKQGRAWLPRPKGAVFTKTHLQKTWHAFWTLGTTLHPCMVCPERQKAPFVSRGEETATLHTHFLSFFNDIWYTQSAHAPLILRRAHTFRLCVSHYQCMVQRTFI